MRTIIFTADNHLGAKKYGSKDRETDFLESFRNIVNLAVEKDSILFLAGDVLDSVKPESHVLSFLKDMNQLMISNKIPAFYISGNHERCNPEWISLLEIEETGYGFINCNDRYIDLTPYGREGDILLGLSERTKDEYLQSFTEMNRVNFLMIHSPLKELNSFSRKAISCDELPFEKCDYILVGDTHIHEQFSKEKCIILSPGSTELCESSEEPNKYVFLLTAKNELLSVNIPTRKVLHLDFSTKENVEEFLKTKDLDQISNALVFSSINQEIVHMFKDVETFLAKQDCFVRPVKVQGRFSIKNIIKSSEVMQSVNIEEIAKSVNPFDDGMAESKLLFELMKETSNVEKSIDYYKNDFTIENKSGFASAR